MQQLNELGRRILRSSVVRKLHWRRIQFQVWLHYGHDRPSVEWQVGAVMCVLIATIGMLTNPHVSIYGVMSSIMSGANFIAAGACAVVALIEHENGN
jgi:hypothetical protein